MKELPKLYCKSSKGNIKSWKIWVDEDETPVIVTEWCSKPGAKVQRSEERIKSGLNIGKSNETTPYEQACSEAQSKWQKKVDEGYVTKISNIKSSIFLPMLAHKFAERSRNIHYPCLVQPKINGVRTIITNEIKYMTRKGKFYTCLGHIDEDAKNLLHVTKAPLDGELYNPELSFEEICSAVKKEGPNTKKLKLYLFDIVDLQLTNLERNNIITKLNPKNNIVVVPTYIANSKEDVLKFHDQFVKEGYEGIIIRNMDGKYVLKYRSKDLQKYKIFQDSEFEIIGGFEGTGTCEGTVTFICKTKEGKEFNCQPNGSWELRHQYLLDLPKLVGKLLTIKYQNLSSDGIPIFGKGILVRDYE